MTTMTMTRTISRRVLSASLASGVLLAAFACSSTQEEPEPVPVVPIPTNPAPTTDAGPPDASAEAAPPPPPECTTAEGCFRCDVTNLAQALNQCTDSQGIAFDNAARLPLYNGGNLPPLP